MATEATSVIRWFGRHFDALHPLLQSLHRTGGALTGRIHIELGTGLAGWLGRRLAKRTGIPADRSDCGLSVEIRHEKDGLYWERRFETGGRLISIFRPIGTWPDGHWQESTGALQLALTVDVIEGGWYWRPLRASLGRLPLPMILFPRVDAYKRIEEGRYRFSVSFTLPLLGMLLRYEGLLDPLPTGAKPRTATRA